MRKAFLFVVATLALISGACAAEPVPLELTDARPIFDSMTGAPIVEVTLSKASRETFADFSSQHVGKRIDLLVDDEVLSSPIIQTPLDMQVIQISGLETLAVATDIAVRLRSKKAQVFVRPSGE